MCRNKILYNYARRLGIQDPQVIKKADEFLRILVAKDVSKTINDVGKTVLSLDVAATFHGSGFDKTIALQLSGLKKGPYQNNLNIIKNVLNLDKPINIKELCVQLSCTVVQETAEIIHKNYLKEKEQDFNHPQYVAASVYTACKMKKIKVEKNHLKTMSRLKNAQWNELLADFDKFALNLNLTGKGAKENMEITQEINDPTNAQNAEFRKKEADIEEYEVWKARILSEAMNEILQREMEQE